MGQRGINDVVAVHGHDGKTIVLWLDEERPTTFGAIRFDEGRFA